jgi:type II secretory pathway pseudopilin PulG
MMIVLIIIGILAVVLTESYLTISRTALKIEQEKNLSEESLILTQVFQAISDEATIDYEAYSGDTSQDLKANS